MSSPSHDDAAAATNGNRETTPRRLSCCDIRLAISASVSTCIVASFFFSTAITPHYVPSVMFVMFQWIVA